MKKLLLTIIALFTTTACSTQAEAFQDRVRSSGSGSNVKFSADGSTVIGNAFSLTSLAANFTGVDTVADDYTLNILTPSTLYGVYTIHSSEKSDRAIYRNSLSVEIVDTANSITTTNVINIDLELMTPNGRDLTITRQAINFAGIKALNGTTKPSGVVFRFNGQPLNYTLNHG